MPDIDIDCKNRDEILKEIKHVPALMEKGNKKHRHNTGVYFHKVPVDPFTGYCSIDYKEAQKRGFFKIDLLNVSIYEDVQSEEHLNSLLEKEPYWDMLLDSNITENIFQLSNPKTRRLLKKMPPKSIDDLAKFLSVIRPPMRHYIGYDYDQIGEEIWDITEEQKKDGAFRKSHAYAYAHAIVVQMNLLAEEAEKELKGK